MSLLGIVNDIDCTEEKRVLVITEVNKRVEVHKALDEVQQLKKIMWMHCSCSRDYLLQGESSTSYSRHIAGQ